MNRENTWGIMAEPREVPTFERTAPVMPPTFKPHTQDSIRIMLELFDGFGTYDRFYNDMWEYDDFKNATIDAIVYVILDNLFPTLKSAFIYDIQTNYSGSENHWNDENMVAHHSYVNFNPVTIQQVARSHSYEMRHRGVMRRFGTDVALLVRLHMPSMEVPLGKRKRRPEPDDEDAYKQLGPRKRRRTDKGLGSKDAFKNRFI